MRTSAAAQLWIVVALCVPPATAEDWPVIERKLPPQGIALVAAERAQIASALNDLQDALAQLPTTEEVAALRPDIEVYEKAARYALEFGEFYKPADAAALLSLIQTARARGPTGRRKASLDRTAR